MKLNVAICDDNHMDLEYISHLLEKWGEKNAVTIQSSFFTSGENFLFHYAENKNYDILLLDIEMGHIDGVTLAKTIRKENTTVQIIFISGYSEYIAEGYEVQALHYLMKPLNEEKFFHVLDRAAEKRVLNQRCLNLMHGGEMYRIPLHEIKYIDVWDNYTTVHAKIDLTMKKPLREFEELLDQKFFKIGRSCIVNLDCISKVTKTSVYLSDGTVLPLPRGAYEAVNRAIISYT